MRRKMHSWGVDRMNTLLAKELEIMKKKKELIIQKKEQIIQKKDEFIEYAKKTYTISKK